MGRSGIHRAKPLRRGAAARAPPPSTVLDWAAAYDANDYNVYLNGSLIANTAETSYSPTLEAGTAYAWRIDPNYPGVAATTGNTWLFATAEDPEEPEEPEEPTGWQREPQWRKGPPAWQKRETGLEGWRRR